MDEALPLARLALDEAAIRAAGRAHDQVAFDGLYSLLEVFVITPVDTQGDARKDLIPGHECVALKLLGCELVGFRELPACLRVSLELEALFGALQEVCLPARVLIFALRQQFAGARVAVLVALLPETLVSCLEAALLQVDLGQDEVRLGDIRLRTAWNSQDAPAAEVGQILLALHQVILRSGEE
jgi:hypothetical protein